MDSYMLRYFLHFRRAGLIKDSKIKGLDASSSEPNKHHTN